jgi:hypothetical protein
MAAGESGRAAVIGEGDRDAAIHSNHRRAEPDEPRFAVPPGDRAGAARAHSPAGDGFNRDGYSMPLRIFDGGQNAAIRAYFDRLLAETLAAGGDSYAISTAHLRCGRVYDLLTHPRIVAYVKDLVGENVVAWGSHFFCKMPGDRKRRSWHQDARYWPLTPSKAVTAWLVIDDASVENACMRDIPGTHLYGHLTYTLSEDDDSVLNQTVPEAEQFGAPVNVELKAGEMWLQSDLLLHGSEANRSARRRCGLALHYCPADVRAGLGLEREGRYCVGPRSFGALGEPAAPGERLTGEGLE